MRRREFLRAAGVAAAGVALVGREVWTWGAQPARAFKLKYAPHFGMFREHSGTDLVAQLEFMAAEGFTALEDNGMRGRTVADQDRIGATLQRLKMTMGVFVAHTINWNEPTLTSMNDAPRDAFLKEIQESVEIAKRVGARWMTVVPGHVDRRLDMAFQTANVIEALRRAAAVLEPHGLVIVIV